MGRHNKGGNKEETAVTLLEWMARPFDPRDAKDTTDLLDMSVKALQDRRASTREAALAAIAGELEKLPLLADVDKTCFNVFALCGVCIKEGEEASLREARLAYRAVGLLALTLRAGSPRILAEAFPMISRNLRDHGQPAMDCLAAVTFAGARNKEDVERSMKAIWDAAISSPTRSTTSPQALAAALSTWAFLLTTIAAVTDPCPRGSVWAPTVASLAGLLNHDARAVRMAAGEALAACVELNLTKHTPRKDMDALAARASELAGEPAGRGGDNAGLPEERDLFRRIAAFLDRGERPEKSLPTSMDGCVALRVTTWAKMVQLEFLTRFLGKGFVKHVEENELLKEAFGYGADEGKVLSVAKRKPMSSGTKMMDHLKHSWSHWDGTIFATYPDYTARRKPGTLLKIGWH